MMHTCILLYIHVTVLCYILASFQKIKKKINLKQKVSETTEECKRLKLRLHCAKVEVDKTYKITLGGARTCSVVNIHVQLFVL